ncbi:hypothetical protein Q3G72_010997 [Acer saccharum]|nr:hypothetical protein Q3G72_010997 [Acer saccharum]
MEIVPMLRQFPFTFANERHSIDEADDILKGKKFPSPLIYERVRNRIAASYFANLWLNQIKYGVLHLAWNIDLQNYLEDLGEFWNHGGRHSSDEANDILKGKKFPSLLIYERVRNRIAAFYFANLWLNQIKYGVLHSVWNIDLQNYLEDLGEFWNYGGR